MTDEGISIAHFTVGPIKFYDSLISSLKTCDLFFLVLFMLSNSFIKNASLLGYTTYIRANPSNSLIY